MSGPEVNAQAAAEARRIDRALDRCARKGGAPSAVALRVHAYLRTLGPRRQALASEMLLLDAAAYRLMNIEVERQRAAEAGKAAAPAPEAGA